MCNNHPMENVFAGIMAQAGNELVKALAADLSKPPAYLEQAETPPLVEPQKRANRPAPRRRERLRMTIGIDYNFDESFEDFFGL